MITYEQIEQANSKLSTVQLGTGNKKKDYVMVPQRVKAFRMLYPQGFILTDIVSHENNVVVMQARAGYYSEDGSQVILGTGLAFEEKGKGMVNGTSYIENCETSAVGRALGFLALGIDGGGICSAEELVNAITAQKQNEKAELQSFQRPQTVPGNAVVTTGGATVPPVQAPVQAPAQAPVQVPAAQAQTVQPSPAPKRISEGAAFLINAKAKIEKDIPGFNFGAARQELVASGEIENVPSAVITLDQASAMISKMYEKYGKAG